MNKEAGRSPVKIIGDTSFMFIQHQNIYAVAVSQGNAQVALAFQFLHEVRTAMWLALQPPPLLLLPPPPLRPSTVEVARWMCCAPHRDAS